MLSELNLATVVVGFALAFMLAIYAVARRYKKVGPNQVMIISGRKKKIKTADGRTEEVGFRIRSGGGAFILPLVEKVDLLSLEIITLDITTPEVYTRPGVPIVVDGVAQIKIGGDEGSIRTAAEQFLGMPTQQIKDIALQTVEGHLRAIVGTMTIEEIYKNRDQFASSVQEVAVSDLANMGLKIVSFTLKDIRDNHGYLEALGKPRTAEVKRDAIIAQAEADRDAAIKSAQARQLGEVAKFLADTQIAEAQKNFLLQKAGFDAATNEAKAQADLAYDLQRYKTNQALKREEVQVSVVEKEQQITVQEREILRREKELEATVKRQADAERYRIQTEAEATRFRYEAEARGQAEAQKAKGLAQAEVVKATGTAEADVIALKGAAEADAMAKKAGSWKEYNEAAIVQLVLQTLPEIAKAISEPLSRINSMAIVSSGDGAGASKLTNEVATIMAQIPPIVESLSGVDLKKLVDLVPQLKSGNVARKEAAETAARPPDAASTTR
jgi:flotillin